MEVFLYMFQNKIIRSILILLSFTFPLFSYASCPSISEIEVQPDQSYIGKTNQGIWKQFENEQSHKSVTGTNEFLSLYYVFGTNSDELNHPTNVFEHIVCIYRVINENDKYVVLMSPKNRNKYRITFPNTPRSNDWKRIIQNTRAVCIPNESLSSLIQCEFAIQ